MCARAADLSEPDYGHWDVLSDESERAFAVISRDVDDNSPSDLELFLVLPEARGRRVGKALLVDIAAEYGPLGGEFRTEVQAAFYRASGCSVRDATPAFQRQEYSLSLRPLWAKRVQGVSIVDTGVSGKLFK